MITERQHLGLMLRLHYWNNLEAYFLGNMPVHMCVYMLVLICYFFSFFKLVLIDICKHFLSKHLVSTYAVFGYYLGAYSVIIFFP